MPLADDVIVYPGHGAGSACGKNMSTDTVDTLGNQKQKNYALNQSSKEDFIEAVTDGLLPPPAYFGANVAMNKKGYDNVDDVIKKGKTPLSPKEFETAAESTGALILDTRDSGDFAKGFVPRSISIGINGDFAPWVGSMIGDVKQPLLLVVDEGKEEEVVIRLSRVGFDNVIGFLKGGIEAWKNDEREIDTVDRITAEEFKNRLNVEEDSVFDVRKESEWSAEHVEESYSRPLANINEWIKDINPDKHFYVHCAGGYRSMIASSILQSRGYHNFTEIEGGFNSIAEAGVPKTDYVCQSKVMKS